MVRAIGRAMNRARIRQNRVVRRSGTDDWVTVWNACHACGWCEDLTEWHNAFWAADHHVRYDCGRREQVSSGNVVGHPPFDQWSNADAWSRARMSSGDYDRLHQWVNDASDLMTQGIRARMAYDRCIEAGYEGGMWKDPTPTHMGLPPRGGYAEGPTAELGAITAEVGQVAGDMPGDTGGDVRGGAGEQGQGHTGWWPWGKGR